MDVYKPHLKAVWTVNDGHEYTEVIAFPASEESNLPIADGLLCERCGHRDCRHVDAVREQLGQDPWNKGQVQLNGRMVRL